MTLLELYAGIGGFSKGLTESGFRFDKVLFSEINKHAIANFKYNYPDAENIGSVTTVINSNIERPNIITFGSPCQDFSVAGEGRGLAGSESSLIRYAIDILWRFKPDVFVWENVKGVLFSKHRTDFWWIIKAFSDLRDYRIEWQLLNTSWFLPQNRERIYLVGRLANKCTGSLFPFIPTGGFIAAPQEQEITPVSRTGTLAKCYAKQPNMGNYIFYKNPGEVFNPDNPADYYGRLRMLTEIECERLQGFPDDYTKFGDYNGRIEAITKTHRYELLGNAVSVPVVKEVGQRILSTTNFNF